MLNLFANLPSTSHVPPKTIATCQRLCLEFEHYLIVTHSLRKSFISIKGIYYQAEVEGENVLWMVPHKFVQNITGDVDFRIMSTFIELYKTLLSFVNYRLYTSVGLVYPPKFNQSSDDKGGELNAFIPQAREPAAKASAIDPNSAGDNDEIHTSEQSLKAQAIADSIAANTSASEAEDEDPSDAASDDDNNDPNSIVQKLFPDPITSGNPEEDEHLLVPQTGPSSQELSQTASKLFRPYTFYLSRETPRGPLEFLLKAFGATRIGWDAVSGDGAFMTDENDSRITHQIVDRPPVRVPDVDDDDDDINEVDRIDPSQDHDSESKKANFARGRRAPGRTYVQPQWVWDCVNENRILRSDLYAPGAILPPHLSPFVRPRSRIPEYQPDNPLAQEEGVDNDEAINESEVEDDVGDDLDEAKALTDAKSGAKEITNGDWSGFSSGGEAESAAEASQQSDGLDDGEDNVADDDEELDQKERQLEAAGIPESKWPSKLRARNQATTPAKSAKADSKILKANARKTGADWDVWRRKMMMPNRKRKLYEKMVHSNQRKEEEAEKLREKKRRRVGGGGS